MTAAPARPTEVAADLSRSLWWIAAIGWGGLYLLLGGIGGIIAATAGLDQSVWIGACWWSQYAMLALGTTLVAQYLRPYIAAGVTRRVYGRGVLLLGLAGSLLCGVAMELGFLAERGLTMLWDAPPFSVSADFVGSPAQILGGTLEFSLLHAAYFFAGWLIAATFQRVGVVAGILVIVPAMIPGLLTDAMVLGADSFTRLLGRVDIPGLSLVSLTIVVAALTAAMAAGAYTLLRRAPVKSS